MPSLLRSVTLRASPVIGTHFPTSSIPDAVFYERSPLAVSVCDPHPFLDFDAGTYLVTKTIFVPAGTTIVGEVFSVIMASGPNFANQATPTPVLQVCDSHILTGHGYIQPPGWECRGYRSRRNQRHGYHHPGRVGRSDRYRMERQSELSGGNGHVGRSHPPWWNDCECCRNPRVAAIINTYLLRAQISTPRTVLKPGRTSQNVHRRSSASISQR